MQRIGFGVCLVLMMADTVRAEPSAREEVHIVDASPSPQTSAVRDRVVELVNADPGLQAVVLTTAGPESPRSYTIVIEAPDRLSLWTRGGRKLSTSEDPKQLITLIKSRRFRVRIDPSRELLRDYQQEPARKPRGGFFAQPWWVYAVAIGAVGLGGTIMLADAWKTDHQRVEVVLP